jgi:spore photoproduct lyase
LTTTLRKRCALEASKGPFVDLLRATPSKTVCPNFYALDHARGCTFDPLCEYCYLKDPYYDHGRTRAADNFEDMLAELRVWLAKDNLETCVANAGNLSDSLAFESFRPLMGRLVELFRDEAEAKGRPHTLLLVTKGGMRECAALFGREPCANIIASFSVNAPEAQAAHEKGAASIPDRLRAARKLKDAGWRVRLRVDPMILGYDYAWIADEAARLAPERVNLGTLRADPSMYPVLSPALRAPLVPAPLEEGAYALARYPVATRLALYAPVADRLRDVCSLGLCEETPEVWDALGFDRANASCNCEGHPGHHPGFVPRGQQK